MMQLYKDYPSSHCLFLFLFLPPFMHLSALPSFSLHLQLLTLHFLHTIFVNITYSFAFPSALPCLSLSLSLSIFLARFRWSLAQQQWQFRVQHPQLGPHPSAGGSAHRPLEGVGEVEGAVCNPNRGREGGDRDGEVEAFNVAPYEVKQRSQPSIDWFSGTFLFNVLPWPQLHL